MVVVQLPPPLANRISGEAAQRHVASGPGLLEGPIARPPVLQLVWEYTGVLAPHVRKSAIIAFRVSEALEKHGADLGSMQPPMSLYAGVASAVMSEYQKLLRQAALDAKDHPSGADAALARLTVNHYLGHSLTPLSMALVRIPAKGSLQNPAQTCAQLRDLARNALSVVLQLRSVSDVVVIPGESPILAIGPQLAAMLKREKFFSSFNPNICAAVAGAISVAAVLEMIVRRLEDEEASVIKLKHADSGPAPVAWLDPRATLPSGPCCTQAERERLWAAVDKAATGAYPLLARGPAQDFMPAPTLEQLTGKAEDFLFQLELLRTHMVAGAAFTLRDASLALSRFMVFSKEFEELTSKVEREAGVQAGSALAPIRDALSRPPVFH